jgi:hypothetical protein
VAVREQRFHPEKLQSLKQDALDSPLTKMRIKRQRRLAASALFKRPDSYPAKRARSGNVI